MPPLISADGFRNISDPHVQELGKFAVTVYNIQEKDNLKFEGVVSGYYQVVNGFNYRLVMRVVGGGGGGIIRIMTYEAVVYEERSLFPFKPLLQG